MYLQYRDFSTDPVNFPTYDMGQFIKQIQANGQHFGKVWYTVLSLCMYLQYCYSHGNRVADALVMSWIILEI